MTSTDKTVIILLAMVFLLLGTDVFLLIFMVAQAFWTVASIQKKWPDAPKLIQILIVLIVIIYGFSIAPTGLLLVPWCGLLRHGGGSVSPSFLFFNT